MWNTLKSSATNKAKVPKIFSKVWPANIFANNLIAKLKGLIKKESTSIIIKKNNKNAGTFDG